MTLAAPAKPRAPRRGESPARAPAAKAAPAASMQWVKAPQQERSQKTLARLLDGAESIIRERGLDAVTIPEVVRVAGSSVGSFYARFPDKKALLDTLHERACAETLATAEVALDPALWKGASLGQMIRVMIGFAVRIFGSRRTLMNAFNQAFAGDPGFAARRARTAVALGQRVTTFLLGRRESMGHPDPELAIPMALRVVAATLEQRNALALADVPEIAVTDALLEQELTRLVEGYLRV
jgi:AcrR family transcriptional regulator